MPELHGTAHIRLDKPPVYVPEEIPILSPLELQNMRAALTTNIDNLQHKKIDSRLLRSSLILTRYYT
jgi:hypothetical protein